LHHALSVEDHVSTVEMEKALRWRGALELSLGALWPASAVEGDVQRALEGAARGLFVQSTSRAARSDDGWPVFASADAEIASMDEIERVLTSWLARVREAGAVTAWGAFEGSVLGESDVFSSALVTHHYAVSVATTTSLAIADEARASPRWAQTVAECRRMLEQALPMIA
jgi:hypothetical protein